MILREACNAILAALVAPPCAACGRILDRPLDGAICPACWDAIVPRATGYCLPFITKASAMGVYEGTLRDVIHAFKYDGRRSIAPRLASLMARACTEVLAGADAVVPVPLHPRRLRERGFNQAEELARHLGRPVLGLLRRVHPTPPQVDLPADARRENVRHAFAVSRHTDARVLVLVDDVATTGATLEACARVLRKAGAKEVRAVTAARVATGPR